MKIYGELTFDEIGNVLDTPAATVATRYRRALTDTGRKTEARFMNELEQQIRDLSLRKPAETLDQRVAVCFEIFS